MSFDKELKYQRRKYQGWGCGRHNPGDETPLHFGIFELLELLIDRILLLACV